jgi:hypothetical protein
MSSIWKTSLAGVISDPQWDGPKPIVAAYKVTETMIEYAQEHSGVLPEDPGMDVAGGHLSLFTDYKLINGRLHYGNWNTWGEDFGDGGWLWFPEQYLQNDIIMEGWISHYGPPIEPNPPSDCPMAWLWCGAYNAGNRLVGGKTRLKAVIP